MTARLQRITCNDLTKRSCCEKGEKMAVKTAPITVVEPKGTLESNRIISMGN